MGAQKIMTHVKKLCLSALLLALGTPAVALEVDREVLPRLTLGGRVIATADANQWDSDTSKEDGINVTDSVVLTRFDKRLYEEGVAGAVVGFKEHEGQAVFHQLHAFYWDRNFQGLLGRSRLRNTLLEFPLLRDDDLLAYTHVGNASSNEEFDQLYADQAAIDWYVDGKVQSLSLWAATRRNGDGFTAPDGFDSYGGGYLYRQPEDLRFLRTVRQAGVLFDVQKVSVAADAKWMSALIAGAEINLNTNPERNWSLGLQAIANGGIDDIATADLLHGASDVTAMRTRAQSMAVVVSLRYTARPNLLTRWQAALTLAHKDYSDVSEAEQWSVAPGLVYRLGSGVDLLAQAKYTDYGKGLGGGMDRSVQLGIAFNLDARFNDTIGERDSILNLEHGYIQ